MSRLSVCGQWVGYACALPTCLARLASKRSICRCFRYTTRDRLVCKWSHRWIWSSFSAARVKRSCRSLSRRLSMATNDHGVQRHVTFKKDVRCPVAFSMWNRSCPGTRIRCVVLGLLECQGQGWQHPGRLQSGVQLIWCDLIFRVLFLKCPSATRPRIVAPV